MKFEESLLTKEDRRIRKTKKLLRESLFALLERKSINSITVTELTKLADVNRSTFYSYYNDIPDMANKIQDEIYDVFSDTVINTFDGENDTEKIAGYIKNFLDFCRDNENICRFITRNDCNNKLFNRIVKGVQSVVPDSEADYDGKSDPRYYLTTFALSGMMHVIIEWLKDGMKIPSDDMAKFLSYTYFLGSRAQKGDELSSLYIHKQ